MVYVLNKTGQPLMPTERYGKVRRMLKSGMAKVVHRCPFTIQLLYDAEQNTQPITLGIDAGSKTIGVSATAGLNYKCGHTGLTHFRYETLQEYRWRSLILYRRYV